LKLEQEQKLALEAEARMEANVGSWSGNGNQHLKFERKSKPTLEAKAGVEANA
jgi:hypothetical protein